jgi:hypothetical protein
MQNIADQVNELWNEPIITLDASISAVTQAGGPKKGEVERQCIPARDFMVLRLTSHELDEAEVDEHGEVDRDVRAVMASWAEDGGAWVTEGPEAKQRWVGVGDAPP